MGKTAGITGVFTSILLGAIIWFVLQVIIGVVWWVAVIAGGAVAVVGVLMAVGAIGARAARKHSHGDSMLGAH